MEHKNLLIIGDSYSTFKGYIPEAEGHKFWYSPEGRPQTDVRKVEETWWYPLCEELSLNLVRNDSWSGSPVAFWGWDNVDCSKSGSFIYRLEKLIDEDFFKKNKIDTIIAFGATNDSWIGAELGEIKFEGFNRDDFYRVCPAICYFVGKLKEALPDGDVVFIMNTGLKEGIEDAIRKSCEHFSVRCLELYDVDKNSGHPTVLGMSQIHKQVKAFLS